MTQTEKIAYAEKKMDSHKFDIEYYGRKKTLALLEVSILNDKLKALFDMNSDVSQVEILIQDSEKQLAYHQERLDEAFINYNSFECYVLASNQI